MRWKRKDMAYMSKEIKNYIIYYIKSNKRLLCLITLIFFVATPLVAIITEIGDISTNSFLNQSLHSVFSSVTASSCAVGFIIAFIMPIYQSHYIFNRRSCDLYFSLPMKRGKLFDVQYFTGLAMMMFPYIANAILAIVIIALKEVNNLTKIIQLFLMLALFMIILYTFINFLTQKCNNLLDAIFVAGAYIVIPMVFVVTTNTFLVAQSEKIFVSTYGESMFNTSVIGNLLSLPHLLVEYIDNVIALSNDNYSEYYNVFSWGYVVLWVIIGILCYYFGKKTFLARKEEQAEQRTTSILTFPFIIGSLTIGLILTQISNFTNNLFPIILIFLIYLGMVFFSQRNIKVNKKIIGFYLSICLITLGFSAVYQNTKGFGMVHEVPSISSIKDINLHVRFKKTHTINVRIGDKVTEEKINNLHYTITDDTKNKKDMKEQSISLQKYFIEQGKPVPDKNGIIEHSGYLFYTLKSGQRIDRSYSFSNTESEEKFIKILEEQMMSSHQGKIGEETKVSINSGSLLIE